MEDWTKDLNKNGGLITSLIICIIIILSLSGYIIYNKVSTHQEENTSKEINDNNTENNKEEILNTSEENTNNYENTSSQENNEIEEIPDYYEYIGSTYLKEITINIENNEKVSLLIKDGKISVSDKITNENKEFEISGEEITLLFNDYYQPGATNRIYAITKSGNVYLNEFTNYNNNNIDIINNFKKLDYSNAVTFVKKYINQENCYDCYPYELDILTNSGLVKIREK